jgi:hypothetical protein
MRTPPGNSRSLAPKGLNEPAELPADLRVPPSGLGAMRSIGPPVGTMCFGLIACSIQAARLARTAR